MMKWEPPQAQASWTHYLLLHDKDAADQIAEGAPAKAPQEKPDAPPPEIPEPVQQNMDVLAEALNMKESEQHAESQLTLSDRALEATPAAKKAPGPNPSLFCWSHMQEGTGELALIRLQLVKRASIFACNYAAVISTTKVLLGNIEGEDIWTWVNPAAEVGMGQNGVDGETTDSFLNTETFVHAWDTLINSKHMWPYDFVVKADPDAVFFPDRLRKHVEEHTGESVYYTNCGKYGGESLLYGALEVFSVPAIKTYAEHIKECKELPYKGWGEDYYMQKCMNQLGVANIADGDQVADHRCVGAPCTDYTKVAYHDFKTPEDWYLCFQKATAR